MVMLEGQATKPKIRIGPDEMSAYLLLPMPKKGEEYTIEGLEEVLRGSGVIYGVRRDVLERMVKNQIYNHEVAVAAGVPSREGVDGFFDYHFNRNPDGKPTILADGSVDYWSINKVEIVQEGQVIATYHPAVPGTDGMTVKGKTLLAKRARELPPLKGKGFTRAEDNLSYVADFDGKIELQNDRVVVSQVYEIAGNADLSVGNIDFRGDVIIHGNVCTGVSIKASGNITVDGIVEAARLWAGKDIILRGGMMGDSRSSVFCKGDLSAKFFEYTTVEVWGEIQAEVFMNCQVNCRKRITLSGKKAGIIGGQVTAIQGIEAGNLGNEVEIRTDVRVGNDVEVLRKIHALQKKIYDAEEMLAKVEKGLLEFEKLEEAQVVQKDDPRKMQLLRVKIRDSAMLSADQAELEKLECQVADAQGCGVKVMRTVYPGVMITIDDAKYHVRDMQHLVEYKKHRGEVTRYPVIT